jgi:ComF family protein
MVSFIQFIKSQFLPGQCCLCQQVADINTSLCKICHSNLLRNNCCCVSCATPLNNSSGDLDNGLLCGSCQQHKPFYNQVFSPFLYQQQMVQLIHQFKYHDKLYLGRTLADLFIGQFNSQNHQQMPELIIPVPLHSKRLKHRGFNQSKELANYFSQKMKITTKDDLIERIKLTHTQRGLTLAERKANLNNAFAMSGKTFDNKHVVVVDDVMTTGNTVNEVAKVLKQAGAERVDVWTIARA